MTPYYPMFFKSLSKWLIVGAIVILIELVALHFGFDKAVHWVIWSVESVVLALAIPAAYALYCSEPFGPGENRPEKREKSN